MRLRHLFAFVLSVTLIQTHGQNNTFAKDYFYHTLMKGEVGQAQSQRISVKQITAKRHELWQAWQATNRQYNQITLPHLMSLATCNPSSWQLPDSLEPNATLPFYYGYKGENPQQAFPYLFIFTVLVPSNKNGKQDLLWLKVSKTHLLHTLFPKYPMKANGTGGGRRANNTLGEHCCEMLYYLIVSTLTNYMYSVYQKAVMGHNA